MGEETPRAFLEAVSVKRGEVSLTTRGNQETILTNQGLLGLHKVFCMGPVKGGCDTHRVKLMPLAGMSVVGQTN